MGRNGYRRRGLRKRHAVQSELGISTQYLLEGQQNVTGNVCRLGRLSDMMVHTAVGMQLHDETCGTRYAFSIYFEFVPRRLLLWLCRNPSDNYKSVRLFKPQISVTFQIGLYFMGLVDNFFLWGIFVSPRLSIWSSIGN